MHFTIQADNGLPIYEQVVRQFKFAVAEGVLVPGQVVPSVRDLARSLAINPNTVARAYQQLQDENVLTPLRGRGMAVCSGAKQRCWIDRRQLLADRLSAVLDEALRAGLDADSLRSLFDKSLKKVLNSQESH